MVNRLAKITLLILIGVAFGFWWRTGQVTAARVDHIECALKKLDAQVDKATFIRAVEACRWGLDDIAWELAKVDCK